MIVIEHAPSEGEILNFLKDGIRQLREANSEAKYIVMGTAAYKFSHMAMAACFH